MFIWDWVKQVAWGAFCFGLVVGWITKEAMVRSDKLSISHIAAIIGAIGGAAITKLFRGELFSTYCVGLAIAFFIFTLLVDINPQTGTIDWAIGRRAASSKEKPDVSGK